MRRGLRKYAAPDYAGLSGVVFHSKAGDLVVNTTNSAGVVDGSGNITKIISTHTTVHEFDSNGTAPTLSGTGINAAMVFGGAGNFRHNGLSSVFNAFHFVVGITNLKWTIHGVASFGSGSNPDAVYAICGNAAGSTGNKGIYVLWDNRTAVPRRGAISAAIVKGTVSTFISDFGNNCIVPEQQYVDFWIEVDKNKNQTQEVRLFINGREYTMYNRVDNNTTVTTPSFAMEIGASGNAVQRAVMSLKEITFSLGTVSTDAFKRNFIRNRMAKYRIQPFTNQTDSITFRPVYLERYRLSETRYYLPIVAIQNPVTPDVCVTIFNDSVSHTEDANAKISMVKSTDRCRTWGSKTLVYDPDTTGAIYPKGIAVGYGSDGRLHMLFDCHTDFGAGSTNTMHYAYSDNDGTSWTVSDISASLPSDALASYRCTDKIIENNGVLMGCFYKYTQEADQTEIASYIFRSTDNGANWTAITVKAKSAVNRNEGSIIGLDSTRVLCLLRDESTLEFHQYLSSDNGASFSEIGAAAFGETLTGAGPPSLNKLQINGSDVIAHYYADRNRDQLKVVYGLPAGLISGVSGWNLTTKYVIYQGTDDFHLQYGTVIHTNGGFSGYGMFSLDEFPGVGSGTANFLVGFRVNTPHYPRVKSLLGL